MFENQFGKKLNKRRETLNDVIQKANKLNEEMNIMAGNVRTDAPNNLPPIIT